MSAIITILAMIGGYTVVGVVLSTVMYFRDRSGNSGRYGKHWSDDSDD